VAEFGTERGAGGVGTEEDRVEILNFLVGDRGSLSISGVTAVSRLALFCFFFMQDHKRTNNSDLDLKKERKLTLTFNHSINGSVDSRAEFFVFLLYFV
jgi:hypothetical protein